MKLYTYFFNNKYHCYLKLPPKWSKITLNVPRGLSVEARISRDESCDCSLVRRRSTVPPTPFRVKILNRNIAPRGVPLIPYFHD